MAALPERSPKHRLMRCGASLTTRLATRSKVEGQACTASGSTTPTFPKTPDHTSPTTPLAQKEAADFASPHEWTQGRGGRMGHLLGEGVQQTDGTPLHRAARKGIAAGGAAGCKVQRRHHLVALVDVEDAVGCRHHVPWTQQRARALQPPAPIPSHLFKNSTTPRLVPHPHTRNPFPFTCFCTCVAQSEPSSSAQAGEALALAPSLPPPPLPSWGNGNSFPI